MASYRIALIDPKGNVEVVEELVIDDYAADDGANISRGAIEDFVSDCEESITLALCQAFGIKDNL